MLTGSTERSLPPSKNEKVLQVKTPAVLVLYVLELLAPESLSWTVAVLKGMQWALALRSSGGYTAPCFIPC